MFVKCYLDAPSLSSDIYTIKQRKWKESGKRHSQVLDDYSKMIRRLYLQARSCSWSWSWTVGLFLGLGLRRPWSRSRNVWPRFWTLGLGLGLGLLGLDCNTNYQCMRHSILKQDFINIFQETFCIAVGSKHSQTMYMCNYYMQKQMTMNETLYCD